ETSLSMSMMRTLRRFAARRRGAGLRQRPADEHGALTQPRSPAARGETGYFRRGRLTMPTAPTSARSRSRRLSGTSAERSPTAGPLGGLFARGAGHYRLAARGQRVDDGGGGAQHVDHHRQPPGQGPGRDERGQQMHLDLPVVGHGSPPRNRADEPSYARGEAP